jgi:hypothetical protein
VISGFSARWGRYYLARCAYISYAHAMLNINIKNLFETTTWTFATQQTNILLLLNAAKFSRSL